MVHEVPLPGGFAISDDPARLDRTAIHGFLAQAYWSRTRPTALTDRAIDHSLCLGLYAPDGRQVGFARIMTDHALRAHLSDVFVAPDCRGRGFGRALVAAALDHPALASVTTWTLVTADAHGLYASFGFGQADQPANQMVRVRPA